MSTERPAIYLRISQDRDNTGQGVARQDEDCTALAERRGWEGAEIYRDNDRSAKTAGNRPEFDRLISDVLAGRVNVVVAWSWDRLTRNRQETVQLIEACQDRKVLITLVKGQDIDCSTAAGRLVADVLASVARNEIDVKSERQARKIEDLVSKGLPLGGGRPFGYEKDGLTIRESEAEELRSMVARVLAGDSLGAIIRDLNERGVTTTRGGTWGYTSMRTLLLRERNCGRMVHKGQVVGKAAWDPIVSETDHDAVAALLANPERRTTTNPARRHLLSGIAKCRCGLGMKPGWVKSRAGKKHWIYTCSDRSAGHAHRSMEKVEARVIERALDVLGAVYRREDGTDTKALEHERDKVKAKLDEAADMFADEQINGSQLKAITSKLNARLDEITNELNAAVRGTVLEGAMGITREEWDALSLDRRRKIIDAVMTIEVVPLNGKKDTIDHGVRTHVRTATGRFGWNMPRELERELSAAVG